MVVVGRRASGKNATDFRAQAAEALRARWVGDRMNRRAGGVEVHAVIPAPGTDSRWYGALDATTADGRRADFGIDIERRHAHVALERLFMSDDTY